MSTHNTTIPQHDPASDPAAGSGQTDQPSRRPILLTTWSWGAVGHRPGMAILNADGHALDAAVETATAIELDPSISSVGIGGLPDASGEVSLDACVMTDPDRCGSVCYVRNYARVSQLARLVMDRTIHVMLAGDGAEAFARAQGFQPDKLLTEDALAKWQSWSSDPARFDRSQYQGWIPPANAEELTRHKGTKPDIHPGDRPDAAHDTVGVLALDQHGKLAGVCSTSGMAFKLPGRVGDSPIIGHGLYVDQHAGAATCTGNGELVMGVCGSFLAVERLRTGATPLDAALAVLERIAERFTLRPEHQIAVMTMTPDGRWATAALRPGFRHTVSGPPPADPDQPTAHPANIHQDARVEDPHAVLIPATPDTPATD